MKSIVQYKSLLVSMAAFLVVLLLTLASRPLWPYESWMGGGLIPVIPAIWVGLETARAAGKLDELQQRILLQALIFGLANTALLAFALSMVEIQLSLIWGLPMILFFAGIGFWMARRRYQ